jgi:hypothetical protein
MRELKKIVNSGHALKKKRKHPAWFSVNNSGRYLYSFIAVYLDVNAKSYSKA